MSALTVLEHIDALKKEEDYQGIITLTESLDPEQVSLPIKFEMIAAYLNNNQDGDQKKAYDLLRETDQDFHGMPVWLYLVAGFRINMDQPFHALSMLENFEPKGIPETQAKAIQDLRTYARKIACCPNLQTSIVKLIKSAWDDFLEAEPKILKALKEGDTNGANIATMMAFSSLTNDGLFVILEADRVKPSLVFSPRGFRHMIPIVELIVALAPESVKANWTLYEGLPPARGTVAPVKLPNFPGTHQSPISFAVTEENGAYGLLIASPLFSQIDSMMGHPMIQGMLMALQRAVGEAAFIHCFKTGRIVDELPEGATTLSPEDVIAMVKRHVPNWKNFTLKEIINETFETTYPVKAKTDDFMPREDDVLWSSSHLQDFLNWQFEGETKFYVDFEELGVETGYFAFRTLKGIEADKAILERLIEECNAHPLLGKVIGYAYGQTRVYLDVMLFDVESFDVMITDFLMKVERDDANPIIDLTFRRWLPEVYGGKIKGDTPMSLSVEEQSILLNAYPKLDPAMFRDAGETQSTAEETLAAAEAAYGEGDLGQVRLLLSHLSSADMTSRAKLLLAIAQIGTVDREHKHSGRVLQDCFDVLLNLKDEFAGTLDYEAAMGLIYFFRGEEGQSLRHLEAAMNCTTDSTSQFFNRDHLQVVYERAKRIVMNPKFGMNFYEKCRIFYNFLSASHQAIVDGFTDGDDSARTHMLSELTGFLKLMFPGLEMHIEKMDDSDDELAVVIEAHDDQTVAMEATMLMAVMPSECRDHWSIRLNGIQTDAAGRYESTEHMHYVQLDPSDIVSGRLRMDMTKAYTMTPELWLDYHNGVDTHADQLHRHGIAPMMLVIPNSGLDDEKRLTELDRLATAIVIALGDKVGQYTGKALGLNNDYIDFFVADTVSFLKTVKDIFEREGISNTRYQIFRFGVDALPLTFEIQTTEEVLPQGTLLN